MRVSLVFLATLSAASAWVVPTSVPTARGRSLAMALDYNDPAVATEFAAVQTLTWEDVEEELLDSGIRSPPAMSEMDLKLMLVEVRLRKSGQLKQKEGPPNDVFEQIRRSNSHETSL
ncbi:hypothetical protein MHU86_12743 [Fragilaria crotonensis]|nr:hypothetical protein MHU86_12743 [Fragilaria crotonensis]